MTYHNGFVSGKQIPMSESGPYKPKSTKKTAKGDCEINSTRRLLRAYRAFTIKSEQNTSTVQFQLFPDVTKLPELVAKLVPNY